MTAKAWSTLRARAASAPTTKFTPSVVAPLLGLSSPRSARDNTVTPLRKLGLLEEDGSLTDRGNKWRIDSSFDEACREILDDVYPEELASLVGDDGTLDLDKVKTWFDHKGFGDSNARQMATTYVMIANRQIPDAINAEPKKARKATTSDRSPKQRKPAEPSASSSTSSESPKPNGPTVHLDIQIHIPADASAEQMDRIFASMAKHLYPK